MKKLWRSSATSLLSPFILCFHLISSVTKKLEFELKERISGLSIGFNIYFLVVFLLVLITHGIVYYPRDTIYKDAY